VFSLSSVREPDEMICCRFLNGLFVHVEKAVGNQTLCGMMLFDDVSLNYAKIVDAPPTCLWCIVRKDKWA
jgi:hypothetical protein